MRSVGNRVPNVTLVRCRSVEKITAAVKGVIYSLARWVKADTVITLECDMLVADSLQPLWSIIEQAQSPSVMGCRLYLRDHEDEQVDLEPRLMSTEMIRYSMDASAGEWVTGIPSYETYFWFNSGLLAGTHAAWQHLDTLICSWMPYCALWIEAFTRPFGDEVVMNMAVGRMPEPVTLSPKWNVQAHSRSRQMWFETKRNLQHVDYKNPDGDAAHILHFAGGGRSLMRNVFYELVLNAMAQRKRRAQETVTTQVLG